MAAVLTLHEETWPERRIVGFVRKEGYWYAHLECHHRLRIVDRPPYRRAAWIHSEEGREANLGRPMKCRECGGGE